MKSKNWKEAEDLILVQSWMAVAQDPVRGNDQKADTFWKRVHAEYVKYLPREYDVRGQDTCKNRWTTRYSQ